MNTVPEINREGAVRKIEKHHPAGACHSQNLGEKTGPFRVTTRPRGNRIRRAAPLVDADVLQYTRTDHGIEISIAERQLIAISDDEMGAGCMSAPLPFTQCRIIVTPCVESGGAEMIDDETVAAAAIQDANGGAARAPLK